MSEKLLGHKPVEAQIKPISGIQQIKNDAREHGAMIFARGELLKALVTTEDHASPEQVSSARRLLKNVVNLPVQHRIDVLSGLSEVIVDYQGNYTIRKITSKKDK